MKSFLLALSLLLAGFASSAHAAPDLTAWNQFDVTQTTAAAGSSVSINFQVANLGNAASGAYSIRFYLSADTDINPATDYALSNHLALPSLNALTFSGYGVTLTLPTQDDLTTMGGAGTYHIGMVLDSLNQVSENNEGNNRNVGAGKDRDSLSITIPLPDLIGWDGRTTFNEFFAVLTPNLAWGDVMHFRFAVLNQSGGNSGAFTVRFFLSADAAITSSDYQLGSRTFPAGMKAQFFGGSQDDTFVLPAVNPVGGAGTSYYFGMIVDADNQVAESNEANNASQGAAKDYTTVTIVQPQPTIYATDSVTPFNDKAINFGSVAVDGAGQSRGVQTLTILNNGKASLNVTGITVAGSAFSITDIASSTQSFISTSSLPRVIAKNGGESWVFTVQFDPTVLGASTGTLTITTNDPVTPNLNIALFGTGSAVPDIALTTPEAVETDFGGVVNDGPGGTSATLPIVLKNTGSGPLTVSQNGISFLTGTHFSVVSITSSTQGVISLASAAKTIAANSTETWTVQVRFDPMALGQLTDGLKVLSDDPDEATFNVSLRGTGLNPMHIAVTDSSGSATDKAIAYPNTHADGVGKVNSSATVTLKNSGDAPLTISQNGITFLTGTHFSVASITSDKAGAISLSSSSKQIAGSNAETWTITVLFDPTAAGALADTLRIASNDPAAATTNVSLTGTGLSVQDISVADSVAPNTDNTIPFGSVLNDGAGATEVPQIVTLTNLGTQPLIIAQNGIVRSGSSAYRVVSIVSSTDGVVDITSANASSRTISTAQTETWTITVAFDPSVDGAASGSLDITSNDPDTPVAHVALTGTGATPSITVTEPSVALNVSAGSVFNLKWQDTYAAGNATIALFLDADTNPASGLIPVASGISEDDAANFYAWQADAALVGGTYHVYATITAGSVTRGAYAPGTLKIDAAGSFQLRSSVEVTSPDYAYEFQLNGKIYQGVRTLNPGENVLTIPVTLPDGSTTTERFTVNLVPSLTHKETTQVDKLNRVEQTKNGNGITTTITYDQMNRPISRQSSNGALVTFAYDVLARRTSMTDYTGTTFYEWDDLSRMTAVITSKNRTKGDGDDLALRYEYDKAGRRTAIVYPGGERIEYSYDNAGRMTVVNNVTRSLAFNYTYNATTGLPTKLTRPNGIETVNSYDGMGRLTTIRHQKTAGAMLVAEYFYTLDAAGKASELRTTLPGNVIRREGYSYDRFDRLIQVIYADDGTIDANDKTVIYSYDGNGNRLTQTTKVGSVVTEVRTYTYGNENRLLKVTDQSGATIAEYRYDSAGNRIQKITPAKTTNYSYDERNLLVGYNDGASFVKYEYDGNAMRVARTLNGVRSVFVNDPSLAYYDAVQERDGDGEVTSAATFGLSRLAFGCAGVSLELVDRTGSAQMLTDDLGAMTVTMRYDVFGSEAGNQASARFALTIAESQSGLNFVRYRFYDPETGVFLAKDPLGITTGPNKYLYCGGDPINKCDPSGLWDLDVQLSSSGLILGGVAAKEGAAIGAVVGGVLTLGNPIGIGAGVLIGGAVTGALGYVAGSALPSPSVKATVGNNSGYMTGKAIFGEGTGTSISFSGVDREIKRADLAFATAAQVDVFGQKVGVSTSTSLSSLQTSASISSSVNGPGDLKTKLSYQISPDGPPLGKGSIDPAPQSIGVGVSSIGGLGVEWAIPNFSSVQSRNVGGVLIDKAATLVGQNLSDLRGGVYDPQTGQFVFLGTEGSAAVKDINLDYLYTALQAVYGSAVPPFVTLDPPARAYNQWTDYGDGDGAFEVGEAGGFWILYNPIWSEQDTTVDVTLHTGSGNWTARFDCVPQNIIAGGRRFMQLVFNSWISAPPTGITLNTLPFTSGTFGAGSSLRLNADSQENFIPFTLTNATSNTYVISSVEVLPARHHRKYGGRLENSRIGWVLLEADRIMKCLSVGKDNLTGALYRSSTISIPGYKNVGEISLANGATGGGNIRMWFTPNEMNLKRDLDPVTGRASIVFAQASVKLNTESFILGLPQPAEAKTFADFFTANYDAFAALSFPCVDPADPTGTNIIQVKIFDQLRDVMRAVSLARFFRDNNVPVDMWWLNSWQPPTAYSPKSTPAVTNTVTSGGNSVIMYGGVTVAKPNSYVPSANAKSVADVIQSSHPDVAGKTNGDLKEQVWSANTVEGNLKAVATSATAEPTDGIVNLAEVDLSFPSPGALPLQFVRYYQSSWLGKLCMGAGWRFTPFVMEFERPSWFDEQALMKNAGTAVYTDSSKNTRLRSGKIRIVDLRSGGVLDFTSSLDLGYSVSNTGNVSIVLSGLDANGLPTLTAGQRQGGATLVQLTDSANQRGYKLTTADGVELTFDHEGRLLQTKDRHAKTQTYAWDASNCLTSITDSAGQALLLGYDTNAKLISVTGPHNEQTTYTYTPDGCLLRATHVRSGAYVQYGYNANCQLNNKTRFNGLTAFQTAPDLKGRPESATDNRSNSVTKTFTQDAAGTVRTTDTIDPLVTDPNFVSERQQFDRTGRPLSVRSATNAETSFGYDEGSLAPNEVNLPIAGRPTITIERNEQGQPTRVIDPGNVGAQDVTATYDPTTKLPTQMTDAAGHPTTMLYDGNKNVQKVRRQLAGQNVEVNFGYTASGALNTIQNPLGVTAVTINRDSLDRVTSVVDATGVTLSYDYDTLGRLWKIHDPRLSSAVEYLYDNFDRVIEIRFPVGSIFYSYDAAKGWMTSMTDLLGRVTNYTRDPNTGDITQVVDVVAGGTNRVTSMTYNRFGTLASLTPPGAAPISFTYDQLGRPIGTAEADTTPPGAPKALDSDRATNGEATYNMNHTFTWGAPDTDSGVEGYSYALDAAPSNTVVSTTATPVALNNVAVGSHTFQVKAKGNNGLWGPPAVFNLIIQTPTGYELWRRQKFTAAEVDAELTSGRTSDPNRDGLPNLLEYVLNRDPKASNTSPLKIAVTGGVRAHLLFDRNSAADDVTLLVEASDNLISTNWTTIATKVGADAWTTTAGVSVTEAGGVVTVSDVAVSAPTLRRFLRLRVVSP